MHLAGSGAVDAAGEGGGCDGLGKLNEKQCSACGEIKPLSDFGRHKDRKDGLAGQCRECVKAYQREYYVENREKVRAAQAKYCIEHRGGFRARNAKYVSGHRDEKRAYDARHYAANADKLRSYRVKYYADNPGQARAQNIRRRARKQNASGDATAEQIAARWEVYGGTCFICGSPAEATDHVIPLAAGGSNWPANLRPICKRCNLIKGHKWPYDFIAAGMEIRA